MGELKITVNKSQKALELYCNDRFYSDLIEKLTDYFEENINNFEGYGDIKAVYLKSIVIEKDIPMLDEILEITELDNEWTLEYSGKLISLEDKETGVKYSHVIIVCASFNTSTHELKFLLDNN